MTLSSNSAQTREIGELRNQLKWMDEERRKSGRKLTELEQRLAQQGRDLAERDRKIQELEYHIATVAERLERVPEEDPKTATQEQRLQDLEWHLSNLSTQVARQPNPDEERARLAEEVGRAVLDAQQRWQGEQATAESRVLAELTTLRAADDHLVLQLQAVQESLPSQLRFQERLEPVVGRQEEQAQALARVNEQFATLQESLGALSAQLRERTATLAAEGQSNYAALANRVQEYLDAQAEQFETHTAVVETTWRQQLDEMTSRSPEQWESVVGRQDEQAQALARVNQQFAALQESVGQLSAQSREQIATLAAEAQSNYAALADRVQETLDAQAEQFETRTAVVETAWRQQLESMVGRQDEQAQALAQSHDQIAALAAETQSNYAALVNRTPETSPEIVLLSAQYEQLEQHTAELDDRLSALVADSESALDTRLASVHTQLAGFETMTARVGQLEDTVIKLGNTRELMALFDRVEQELELRQAEDVRLANLISTQEGRFAPVTTSLEEARESSLKLLARMSDVERVVEETRRSAQDFNDNWKPILTEVSRRVGPLTERVTVLNNSILKAEASLQALTGDQSEMRETLATLADESQRNRVETSRQVDAWQATLDEHKDTIERFTQQWLTLSNQYKEARMAVQNFAHWQKQLEQQKREASEMLRIESNRMQSRWDGFLLEIQEKLKNFELDLSQKWQAFELENEQRWAGARRSEQVWREELGAVDELIQKLQQDNRNLIWRVQAAQADAIKKWPRLLMEEVEKAVELNPNRRLSPAGATPRTDLSVVDAIEQGLITIDYDDSATDL